MSNDKQDIYQEEICSNCKNEGYDSIGFCKARVSIRDITVIKGIGCVKCPKYEELKSI